jgi:DNA-binding CsgD family transcriptional regulator
VIDGRSLGAAPDETAPGAPWTLTRPRLLEREAELATIHTFVAAARDGTGRLVVIEGRPGMGKTRLLAEARADAAAAGLTVLAARGSELEREFAYGIVRQLFEPLLASASAELRAELLGGAAELAASLLTGPEPVALERPTDVSFAVQHGLYWLTVNLALDRPVLLAIDDLHWADPPSLRWLLYLARRLEGLPLLLVLASRPPERDEHGLLATELLADPGALQMQACPLGTESIAALAREVFAAEPDADFCAACSTATGGNPLFLRALMQTLADVGVAPTAAAAERVHEVGPEPVARFVTLGLSRLPPEAPALACAGAVLGDGASLGDAAALAKLEPEQARRAAAALVAADILRPFPHVEFVHPVVRASVYETIDIGERLTLHRDAASLLGAVGAEPERVAAHLMRVPPVGDSSVAGVLREAARRSLARGAVEAAVSQLRRALDEPPAEGDRVDVLEELGTAEMKVNGPAAIEHLRQARELIDDPVRGARVGVALAWTLFFTGEARRIEEARELYTQELAALGRDVPELRRRLEAGLAATAMFEPSLQGTAREIFGRVRREPPPPDAGGKMLLALLAFRDASSGKAGAAEAVERAREALAGGLLIQHANGDAPLVWVCEILAAGDLVADAFDVYDASLTAAHRQGSAFAYAAAHVFRGKTFLRSGELADAEAASREAIEACRAWGIEFGRMYPTAFLAEALIERGDLAGAAEAIDRAGFGGEIPDTGHAIYVYFARGRLRVRRGELEPALADLLEVGRRYEAIGGQNPAFLPWRSEAALVALRLGRDLEAQTLAADELELARRWGAPATLGRALRAAALVAGGSGAERLLRESVDVLAPSPARLEHARSLVELGAALRRGNQRSEARAYLREGVELAHRLGARPLVEQGRTELSATGARPRRLELSGPDSLTASERRVAALAVEGMANKEIAQALFVTVKTVEVHLSSVYRKLGIRSRRQLAAALPLSPAVPAHSSA